MSRGKIQSILDAQAAMDALCGETHALPFATAIVTPDLPLLWAGNHIVNCRLPESVAAEDALRQVDAFYAARGTRCCKWVMNAEESEGRLAACLRERGFHCRRNSFYCLATATADPAAPVELIPP